MNKYHVLVRESGWTLYEVEAQDEERASARWSDGEVVGGDTDDYVESVELVEARSEDRRSEE